MEPNDIEEISAAEARVVNDNVGLLSDVIEVLELDMFQNQNQSNVDGVLGSPAGTVVCSAIDTNQQQQQTATYNGISHQHQQQQQLLQQQQQPQQQQQQQANVKSTRKKPYVKIIEQPASKALRFRYECEGRSAGSIPGANSTPENKTYPTIEIVGYKGRAVVVVSCVTKDEPYRPHPHNLVGKEGCKKGVCTIEINSETMRAVFSNLGIQCVKKKDIEAALKAREDIRVDPFKTGIANKHQGSNIDLNVVRLCFQVFLEGEQKGRFTQPLAPVVSEPIYDKKAMSDLVICRLCSCSSTVAGGATIILLCEKVSKEDISVRFFQEKNGTHHWQAFGEFQQTDVHKQTAITFKTPPYHRLDIDKPVTVFIQLYRPSDRVASEPLPFEYIPLDTDPAVLKRKRQKTGGDPMHLLRNFQDLQQNQQPQQHPHDHDGHGLNINLWNIPAIKTEPRETSPQSYAMYRTIPEHTPSPQPHSPSNPYNNPNGTPSPYSMATTNGSGNGLMLSPNQQYGTSGGAGPCDNNMSMPDYGGFQQHPQQQFQSPANAMNPFFNATDVTAQWATPTNIEAAMPQTPNRLLINNLNTNPFNVNNLLTPTVSSTTATATADNSAGIGTNNSHGVDGMEQWNLTISNCRPLHMEQLNQQQHQQHNNVGGGAETGPTVSNLLNMDSDQLMSINMNSEDLQISNLSIST